jgi:hypothetical protein
VTGTLGDAALALSHLLGKRTLNENQLAAVLPRLDHPHPRILAGQALRGLASSAWISPTAWRPISAISSRRPACGPRSISICCPSPGVAGCGAGQDAWQLALAGGDDYELCFTVPQEHHGALDTALANCGVKFTRIGRILAGEPGIDYLQDEQTVELHSRAGITSHESFKIKPELKRLNLKHPLHFLAVGFGSGLSPRRRAPWGPWQPSRSMLVSGLPTSWFIALLVVGFVAGIRICQSATDAIGMPDHGPSSGTR